MTTYDFDAELPNSTVAAIYTAARSGGRRVLDLGSGPAVVAARLAEADGFDLTCVDVDPDVLKQASLRGIGETVVADLESPTWWEPLSGRSWDTVLLGEVLERLRDPVQVVRSLREHHLIGDDGALVVSFRNAAHQAVVAELMSGDFRYEQLGLLDETHLRWFTLESMTRLLESSGFVVHEVRRILQTLAETPRAVPAAALSSTARQALDELGLEGRTYQYVLRARPASETMRLATLHEQVQGQRQELAALQQRLEQTERLLVAERERVREELAAGARELAQLETRLAKAERRAARLQSELRSRKVGAVPESPRQLVRASARLGRRTARRAVRAVRDPKKAARRLRARRSR